MDNQTGTILLHLLRALQASENRFRSIIEANADGILVVDLEGTIRFANSAAEGLFGQPADDLVGEAFGCPLVVDEKAELDILQPAGDLASVEMRVAETSWQGEPAYLTSLRDITERRRAEEEIHRLNQFQANIIDDASLWLDVLDEDGNVVVWNRAAEDISGYSREEVVRHDKIWQWLYPDAAYRNEVREYVNTVIETGASVEGFETTIHCKDGQTKIMSWNSRRMLDETGSPTGSVVLGTDVTERKRAEEALRESRQLLETLFEAGPDGIVLQDNRDRITRINQQIERMFGYNREDLVGQPIEVLVPERYRQRHRQHRQVYRTAPHARPMGLDLELYGRRQDGTEFPIDVMLSPLQLEGRSFVVAAVRDITERKQVAENLRRVNRALKVLSECNQVLVRTDDASTLLDAVCDILVEMGGYRLAWVGFAEQDAAKTVRPVAAAGFEAGYLEQLELTWADTERGRGPTGTAIRTGQPAIATNILNDPRFAPWRQAALERSYASSIALPLVVSQQTIFGALNIYAPEPDAFDAKEVRLLTELADDLAYGIAALRTRAERRQMEARLKESQRRLQGLFDHALDAILLADDDAFYVDANPAASRLTGYSREELLKPLILRHDDLEISSDERRALKLDLVKTLLVVPLHVRHDPTGVLVLGEARAEEREPFSTEKQRLAAAIAAQSASALHRATLHEQTIRSLQRLSALHEIDMTITASVDLQVTLSVVLDQAISQLSVDATSVMLFDPAFQTLEYVTGRGFRSVAGRRPSVRLGDGLAGRVAYERRTILVPDLRQHDTPDRMAPALAGEGFVAYAGVPLIAKGEIKGVLELYHRAPLDPEPDWLDFLKTLAAQTAIAIDNTEMFDNLQRSNTELTLAYDTTLEGWAKALELRDQETEGHTRRVTDMALRLASAMGIRRDLEHLRRGALLHDIGKMGIPDTILLKPGPLSDDEWEIMKRHPVYAYEMLSPIDFLKPALDIPYCHHERWDGTGYPQGLQGEEIPLPARIFAVVDVYDALTSDRPYREAWPEEKALNYIREEAGRHFDPAVVKAFFEILGDSA